MLHTDIRPNVFTDNPRVLHVLKTLGSTGYTLYKIAETEHRSIHTINQQVKLARELLGARSTYHAIYKAAKMGLI